MAVKEKKDACLSSAQCVDSCCKVESLIGVDDRGQMVLPKDIRDKAGIKAGDKLALISCIKDGEICCLTLMKVDGLAEMVKDSLGPVLKEIF